MERSGPDYGVALQTYFPLWWQATKGGKYVCKARRCAPGLFPLLEGPTAERARRTRATRGAFVAPRPRWSWWACGCEHSGREAHDRSGRGLQNPSKNRIPEIFGARPPALGRHHDVSKGDPYWSRDAL